MTTTNSHRRHPIRAPLEPLESIPSILAFVSPTRYNNQELFREGIRN